MTTRPIHSIHITEGNRGRPAARILPILGGREVRPFLLRRGVPSFLNQDVAALGGQVGACLGKDRVRRAADVAGVYPLHLHR